LQQQWWQSPDFLKTIYVQTPKGTDVPLSAFHALYGGAHTHFAAHQGQFPPPRFPSTGGKCRAERCRGRYQPGRSGDGPARRHHRQFAGTARAYQDALENQPVLIATALIAVYIVLGILYESLIHPLTIISTLPSAGVGAAGAMVLFKSDLDLVAMIGISC